MKCCGKVLSLEVRSGGGRGHADAAVTHRLVSHQFITIIRRLILNGDREFSSLFHFRLKIESRRAAI
jgi:hypothetical protein